MIITIAIVTLASLVMIAMDCAMSKQSAIENLKRLDNASKNN